jgi:hypothetical protein
MNMLDATTRVANHSGSAVVSEHHPVAMMVLMVLASVLGVCAYTLSIYVNTSTMARRRRDRDAGDTGEDL